MKLQRGFTAIEGLLILVIAGALASVGWFVYDKHHKSQPKAASQTTSTQTTKPSTTSQTSYFTIKEYNVKFPYDNNPVGLNYQATSEQDGTTLIYFNSTQLSVFADQNDPTNWCTSTWGNLGALSREDSAPTDTVPSDGHGGLINADEHYDGVIAHFGGHYYVYRHFPPSCSKNDSVTGEKVNETELLLSQLKHLQAQ